MMRGCLAQYSISWMVEFSGYSIQDFKWMIRSVLALYRLHPCHLASYFRHYVVAGPENSPYEGGYYHGKLVFPPQYPFKPPSIYMITPNGRFKCNTRLCLSISDFHPDTWNPAWSVSTILTGLLSFMVSVIEEQQKRSRIYKCLNSN